MLGVVRQNTFLEQSPSKAFASRTTGSAAASMSTALGILASGLPADMRHALARSLQKVARLLTIARVVTGMSIT